MNERTETTERRGFPRDADEARTDAELTRRELGETVGKLAERVDVRARVKDRVIREGERIPEPVRTKAVQGASFVRHHPAPVAVTVLALVVVLRQVRRRVGNR